MIQAISENQISVERCDICEGDGENPKWKNLTSRITIYCQECNGDGIKPFKV